MAMNGGRVDVTIGYKVDETGITKLRQQLQELSTLSATQLQQLNPTLGLQQANGVLMNIKQSVAELQGAMNHAFDSTTGVMNLQQLQQGLNKLNLQQIQNDFNKAGVKGREAMLAISKATLTTNVQLRQTESIFDRMGQTLANTVRWSISSNAINAFTGAVQQAYGYVQHLDSSLNDIRIVTGKSAEEMSKFAVKANDAAKSLGSSTTEYTEAALIYYQQGLSDEESAARAETTIKAANVTGQTGKQVSEELTAVWNGYKVSAEEAELYVDKLAAVAATTASDLEELSTGMSKVASAANAMGVDVDQLNAQLATIISVTRQAPETAGTALKTIYARIEDLKLGGSDEDGIKLGDVSSGLSSMGIEIKNSEGELRDLGEVIEEVAGQWDTWTESQQTAIAQLMAGKRQYNNLIALFSNWDMYTSSLETSKNAVGTLQEQQDIYMESTAAHLEQLKTEWEDLYDSLLDNKDLNTLIDSLTKILNKITDIVDTVGGLKGMIPGLVGVVNTIFSKQIANAFGSLISNINAARQNSLVLEQTLNNIKFQKDNNIIGGAAADKMTELQTEMNRYWSVMSAEQINASNRTIQEIGEWEDKREAIQETTNAVREYFQTSGDQRSRQIASDTNQNFGASGADTNYLLKDLEKSQTMVNNIQNEISSIDKIINKVNSSVTDLYKVEQTISNIRTEITKTDDNGNFVLSSVERAELESFLTDIETKITQIKDPNSSSNIFNGSMFQRFEANANNSIKGVSQTLDALFDRLQERMTNVNTNFASSLDLSKMEKSINTIEELLNRRNINGLIDNNKLQQARTTINQIRQEIEDIKNPNVNKTDFTEGIQTRFRTLAETIGISKTRINEFIENLKTGKISAEEFGQMIDQAEQSLDRTNLRLQALTQGVVQLIGSFSSLIYGFNTLSNIGSIWSDDDIDAFEKVKKTLLALALALPMLQTGFTKLGVSLKALTGVESVSAAMTAILTGATTGLAGASAAAARALDLLEAKLLEVIATIAAIPGAGVVVAIAATVTAAIIGVAAAVKSHQKNLENEAEAAKNSAETQKEKLETLKDEKDAIDDLADSYQKYTDLLKANGKLTEDEKNEVYELVKAYGDQDLIIKALAGDYDSLGEAIERVQRQQDEAYKKQLESTVLAEQESLTDSIIASSKESARDKQGYDLSGYSQNFVEDLKRQFQISIDAFGHIGWEDLNKLLTSDSVALHEFLDKHQQDSDKAVNSLRTLLTDNQEAIKTLKEDQQSLGEAELTLLGESYSNQISNVKDVFDYEELIDEMSDASLDAFKKQGFNNKEAKEQGQLWAKNFLDGYGEEFVQYNNSTTISNTILDAILPDDNEVSNRLTNIRNTLKSFSKDGSVDLLNRPTVTDTAYKKAYGLGEDDYATVNTHTYGSDETGYFNFTPIIVDPETGEYQGFLSEEDLANYANKVISGAQEDFKNLQIGTKFDTEEEADKVAATIHGLHDELNALQSDDYVTYLNDRIGETVSTLSDAQRSIVAQNITLFSSMYDNGEKSIEDIFDLLSNEFDAAEAQDHLFKIQAILDENSKDKIQEKLQDLVNDETIEVPFTVEQFNYMDEDQQQMELLALRQQELDVIEKTNEAAKEVNEEKLKELKTQKAILETEIQSLKYRQQYGFDSSQKQTLDSYIQTGTISDSLNNGMMVDDFQSMYDYTFGEGTDQEKEAFIEKYKNTMSELVEIYKQCQQEGADFSQVIAGQWDEVADGDVQRYLESLQLMRAQYGEDSSIEGLVSEWADVSQYDEVTNSLEELENGLSDVNSQISELEGKEIIDTDWVAQAEETKKAIDAVNDAIDDLQSAYQTLQDVVDDYNEDGKLNLDNLQSLMEMDDAYVASLELENGQLSLNETAYEQAVQTKLDYLRTLAAQTLLEQLEIIAKGQLVTSNSNLGASNVEVATTYGTLTDAAEESREKLLELKEVQDAMAEDSEATNTAIDAYYNRIAMIENLANQTTQEQLEKKSSSSSSSSSNDPDEKDTLNIGDIDLYRGINEELEKIETTLSRIQTIDDHSWGASSLAALKTESKLLQDQIDKYEEKAELQEGDLSKQKASLESQGIEFSSDGATMTNASEKLKTLYEEYNAMVNTYNAMSKEEQEEYKDTVEKKKDAIDNLEDAIGDYESLYSEYQNTIDKIQDEQYKQIENNVKRFNYDVEIHLELSEARKKWNDFWYDVVKDVNDDTDFGGRIADSLANLSTQVEKNLANLKELVGLGTKSIDESTVGKLVKHVQDTTEEVSKQIASAATGGDASIFKNDSALSKEKLTNYRDQLISALTEAKEAVDSIADSYLSIYDKAEEKIENQRTALDSVGKQINHNIKLLNLRKFDLSDSKRNSALDKQYQQQYDNNMKVVGSNKLYVDNLKKQLEEEKKLAAASEKGSKDQKTHLEAITKLTKQYQDAVDSLNTSLETSLEDLQNWYENSVTKIQSDLDKSLSGGLGLGAMEEEWSLVNGWAEKYYDNVERAIELESYTNDLEDAANAIGLSAENQAKLNDFREQELTALKAKSRLTKYDIDESRARLEIMKQEMALEDQRANKSKMRLRRDNQGNYNYQYVGDQEAEDQAEKGLLTAKKEWYQIVKKQWKDATDYTIELSKRATELQNEYQQAVYDKDVKRQEELKALIEQNQKELQWAYSEAEKNKRDLYSGTAKYFADVNNAEILPTANTTVRQLLDKWAKSDDKNSFTGGITKAIEELDKVAEDFCNKQIELMKKAGVQWGKLRDQGIDPTKESLDDFVDSEDELKESLEKVNDELSEQAKNLKTAEDAYNKFKETAVAAIKAANDELEKLAKTEIDAGNNLNNTIKSDSSSSSDSSNTGSTTSDTSDSGSDAGDGGGAEEKKVEKRPAKIEKTTSGQWGFKDLVDKKYLEFYDGTAPYTGDDYEKGIPLKKKSARMYFQKYADRYYGFRTGGYTGEWADDSGKLAVLHQKELVLNESDTSNLLKAVDIIRQLSSSVNINGIAESLITAGAMQAQMLAQVGSGLMSAMSSIVTNNSQNYSSNMTVNADFSGVRSADAIYQALRELESYGSQQAYSNAPFSNKSY